MKNNNIIIDEKEGLYGRDRGRALSFHRLIPVLSIILFSGALWILHKELRGYHYHEIAGIVRELPNYKLILAFSLTSLSYFILTGYDKLSLLFIRQRVAYMKIALTSFISYAFSHNIGLPMLSGGTVRYRLYSDWGLSAIEVGKIVIFNTLTLAMGFLTAGGAIFLIRPILMPPAFSIPIFSSVRPLGVIFIGLVTIYVSLSILRKRPIKIMGWEFLLPPPHICLAQITLSSLDWTVAAGVLYVLLPKSTAISFPVFVGLFILAQISGLISQVPGGLGVFEALILLLLSPVFPASAIMGSLLIYRVIYYFCPLLIATVLLGVHEILSKKERFAGIVRFGGRWIPALVPQLLALITFVGGGVLLFSGSIPSVNTRLLLLNRFLPLGIMEISHFLGSLVGMGLILLALSLQRRIDAAYFLAVILLFIGILLSLLKGFDYEEAIVLAAMFVALLPCRKYFYRKASLISQPFNTEWIIAVFLAFLSSAWLGIFSFKHIEYSNQLWWQFTLSGDAPRFLRAIVGIVGMILFLAIAKLLKPAMPSIPLTPSPMDLERIRKIVEGSSESSANLALLMDKAFLFGKSGESFIMYGITGKSFVALRDPVGSKDDIVDLIWEFHEMSNHFGAWTVFYEVKSKMLPYYLDLGLHLLKLGEEGRVLIDTFSLEGGPFKGFRHILHKFDREGYQFNIIMKADIPPLLSDLKGISDAWLKEKKTREKGFSLGLFSPEYIKQFPAGIVRKENKIVAFANIWLGGEKEEFSVDLMRYLSDAPNGVMDYLFTKLILWGKAEGYHWFNIGMAPLSGLENRALAPLWNRIGAFVFRHGEHFYNFQGLRQYKEKFSPVWEPRYLAFPNPLALPQILVNIASLVSRGIKGVIAR